MQAGILDAEFVCHLYSESKQPGPEGEIAWALVNRLVKLSSEGLVRSR